MRPLRPLLCIALASALSCTVLACQDKMPVEKRAEQMAASASASASASGSTAPPDPKEERYAKLRKDLKDRSLDYLTTLQRIYVTGTKEDIAKFRTFFPATKEGEKEADAISKEAAFVGKEGMSIKRHEISELALDDKMQSCTVDVFEEESQRGKPRCIIYKLKWKEEGSAWHRMEKTPPKVVPCDG